MNHLKHQASKLFDPDTAPDHTIQIKVPGNALRAVVSNGLKKTTFCERYLPHNYSRWVSVEASEHGTNDSVFFVPERPNVDQSHMRLEPAQFVKVNQNKHDDVVRRGDEFEISFAGMSVAQMDIVGNNELLLCSLTRNDGIMPPDPEIAETTSNQAQAQVSTKNTDMSQTFTAPSQKSDASNQKPLDAAAIKKDKDWIELADLAELPTALTVQPGDIPFLHYDPVVDGHDVGSSPNSFVPIPGSKRVYLQRSGALEQDVLIRFTVMEIDKLSEEQLIAIKSLEDIGKSVGKAAATVPYLKFISWILKFANFLGRSALKKVAEPEHVLSKDMAFLLADPENGDGTTCSVPSSTNSQREEFGNYLRVSDSGAQFNCHERDHPNTMTNILFPSIVWVLLLPEFDHRRQAVCTDRGFFSKRAAHASSSRLQPEICVQE